MFLQQNLGLNKENEEKILVFGNNWMSKSAPMHCFEFPSLPKHLKVKKLMDYFGSNLRYYPNGVCFSEEELIGAIRDEEALILNHHNLQVINLPSKEKVLASIQFNEAYDLLVATGNIEGSIQILDISKNSALKSIHLFDRCPVMSLKWNHKLMIAGT